MNVNKDTRQDCLAETARAMQPVEAGDSARRCMDCEEIIPQDRLKAMPEALRCVECQSDFERCLPWDWGMGEC